LFNALSDVLYHFLRLLVLFLLENSELIHLCFQEIYVRIFLNIDCIETL
jgi:hypothetical protein